MSEPTPPGIPAVSGASPSPFVPLAAGFLLNGIAAVLLGPLIPVMSPIWAVTPSEVASLFLAQFLGSALGSLLSSLHLRRSLLLGYSLIAVGFVGLAFAGWPWAIAAGGLLGLGVGLSIPATNLWLALVLGDRRGPGLAALNFVWGIGSAACPLLFTLQGAGVEAIALLTAVALLVVGLVVWLSLELGDAPNDPSTDPEPTRDKPTSSPLRRRALPVLAVMMFCYVGAETVLGGWLVTLSDQMGTGPSTVSMVIGSGFWMAILVGRGVSIFALRRIPEKQVYLVGLALALTGVVVVLMAPTRAAVASAAVLAGLGLAPLFPLHVAFLTAATAAERARGTGWVFSCAALGGGALPWLTAQVAGDTLRQGFIVPLVALVLLTLGFGALCHRAGEAVGGQT